MEMSMKRIVNGVTYNTETSTAVAKASWEGNEGEQITGVLYQTRGGAFFVDREETKTVWNEREGKDEERITHSFEPLSAEQAHAWMMEGEVEVYHNPFDEPPEAEAEREAGATIYIRVPSSLKKSVDEAAQREHVSGNVWAMRCVQRCLQLNEAPPIYLLKDPYPHTDKTGTRIVLPIAEGMPVANLTAAAARRLANQLLAAVGRMD